MRSERRQILKRDFHFWCECEACVHDFLPVGDLPRSFVEDKELLETVGGREEVDRLGGQFSMIATDMHANRDVFQIASTLR